MGKKADKGLDIGYQSLEDLLDRACTSSIQQAIQRIENGKASDGLLQMFIRRVLPETQMEMETKRKSLELMDAKIDKFHSEVASERMWEEAMSQFAKYAGNPEQVIDFDAEVLDNV